MAISGRIRWNCSECGQLYKTRNEMAGETITCNGCEAKQVVPIPPELQNADAKQSATDPPKRNIKQIEQQRIRWNCPECNQLYKSPVKIAGQSIDCSTCNATLTVPNETARLRWSCTHCDLTFRTTSALAGQIIECPQCNSPIPVPSI